MKNLSLLNKEELYIKIGSRLRAARDQKGLNGIEVGEKLGMDRASLSHIERGKNMPTLFNFLKLCMLYDVDPSYILMLDENPAINNKLVNKLFEI